MVPLTVTFTDEVGELDAEQQSLSSEAPDMVPLTVTFTDEVGELDAEQQSLSSEAPDMVPLTVTFTDEGSPATQATKFTFRWWTPCAVERWRRRC
eukprot:TRINITY_DN17174_c0_g3_i4.p2 TRINITY_DN17174_c0_g3~~TRINITY_DN17174_c0_g3_i4.p2  ORF type:complete len:105 (-),score=20.73 TRINITY_DN17174_c0_g3_i4:31-315(-)